MNLLFFLFFFFCPVSQLGEGKSSPVQMIWIHSLDLIAFLKCKAKKKNGTLSQREGTCCFQ